MHYHTQFPLYLAQPSCGSLYIHTWFTHTHTHIGFPGDASGKEPACQCRRGKRLRVQSLGVEGPLEESMATHSSILDWTVSWTREPGGLPSTGVKRVRHLWSNLASIYIYMLAKLIRSDQIRSVAQSCPTLCDPMNCSTPGLPVHHQLPEFFETHVHRVSDAWSSLL